ncbi:Multidrug resistance-associated protein 9 [Hypsibius exemplaris]|uniref:Multidrug resistance-associated protein 9 n=1 Tax=Hypsibius exemplaris TaxID=2072580 RepID=A0A1W0X8K2_HYPEX|nr:Multidrug resistance-associated protein 9 [Hypsibius exemplaris]
MSPGQGNGTSGHPYSPAPGLSELSDPLVRPTSDQLVVTGSSPATAPIVGVSDITLDRRQSPIPTGSALLKDTTEADELAKTHVFALVSPGDEHFNEPLPIQTEQPMAEVEEFDVEVAKPKPRTVGCSKYRHALRVLVPCRCDIEEDDERYSRLDRVGCISFVLYSWMTGLMWRSYKRGLRLQDMWKTSWWDSCDLNTDRLQRIWKDEVTDHGEKNASFFRACWQFCRTRLIVAGIIYCCCLCMGFLGPTLFVQKLIQQTEENDKSLQTKSYGVVLVVGLAGCEVGRAILFVTVWAINYRTCIRLKSACNGLVYRKIFQLNNLQQAGSSSEIVTLISSDIQRIFDAVRQSLLMIGGPVLMVGGTIYSVWLLGWMAFVGAGVLVLFYPVQAVLSKTLAKLRRRSVQKTESRIHLMTEIINSIRLIKMYAWEYPFCEKVVKMREEEHKHLAMTAWTQSTNLSLTPLVPVIAAVVTFLCHMAVGGELEPTQKFLLIAPVVRSIRKTKDSSVVLHVDGVTFSWEPFPDVPSDVDLTKPLLPTTKLPAALRDISMQVKTGSLVGLCGRVGCGKSSLFHGLLGQIYSTGGKLTMRGRIAYVPQEAWLVNDTVRENICFGEPYNYERYNEVVSVCHLTFDFTILPGGDECVIGERGSTLSGGQRQRISLARAVYSDREIFLLDDPLSAVDATVGADIFHNCIMKYLRGNGKTILLVSGQMQYLEQCDRIHVFKAGTVVQSGTHAELLREENSEYSQMVLTVKKDRKGLEAAAHGTNTPTVNSTAQVTVAVTEEKKKAGPVEAEDSSKGSMGWKVYRRYVEAAGGLRITTAILLVFAINMGLNTFSSWWLSFWFNHGSQARNITLPDNSTKVIHFVTLDKATAWYPGVYAGAVGLVVLLSIFRSFVFMKVTLRAAKKLHESAFSALMHAKTRFFDLTPNGRILNRISKDMDEVDSQIPFVSEIFLQNSMYCFFALLNIAIIFPWLLIAIVVLAGIFVWITRCFRSGVRDLKRLENVTTSPVLSLAASTVQGLSTIQAYGRQADLVQRFQSLVDLNSFPLFCFHCAIRWLGLRLDFLTIAFTVCAALLIVLLPDHITAAQAGLTLSFAVQMSGLFQYTVRLALETEGRFTSVERIIEYIDELPQEDIQDTKDVVSRDWPLLGRVVMERVVLRYDATLSAALKGISFVAEPGQRIGIVGRTGSGKSSLAAALFRLVEIESGQIQIDGVDTRSVNLITLRSRLSIIPQDPVLFAGSLRYNLDPFEKYTEVDIWDALSRVNLHHMVKALEGGLDFKVTQNGCNFSVGERQLICMARALLRRSRILFMDEATASIDSRTDSLLQETIRTAFHNCTMLTVAHRLNTVIHYDKILVIADGRVVEFGSPFELMNNSDGVFCQMVEASLATQS